MNKQELADTASAMVAPGKGLLARQGKYSDEMEHDEAAAVGFESLHSHLGSQDWESHDHPRNRMT